MPLSLVKGFIFVLVLLIFIVVFYLFVFCCCCVVCLFFFCCCEDVWGTGLWCLFFFLFYFFSCFLLCFVVMLMDLLGIQICVRAFLHYQYHMIGGRDGIIYSQYLFSKSFKNAYIHSRISFVVAYIYICMYSAEHTL